MCLICTEKIGVEDGVDGVEDAGWAGPRLDIPQVELRLVYARDFAVLYDMRPGPRMQYRCRSGVGGWYVEGGSGALYPARLWKRMCWVER